MKVKKIFLFLVTAGLVASSASFAGTALTQSKSLASSGIHTTVVTNTGYRTVTGKVIVFVGRMGANNTCNLYAHENEVYFNFPSGTKSSISLNGDVLAHDFGLNYNCGSISLSTDKQNTYDTFRLYNDGYTYYMTSPDRDEMTVN